MLLAQHWFWYPGEQMEGISGTPETLGWHYKREAANSERAFSNSELEKILEKTLLEFKKREGNTTRYP